MKPKKIFLDANILLELLLVRAKSQPLENLLAKHDARYYISPLSVHLCYHYCLQEGVAAERIAAFLQAFDIAPMDYYVVSLAQRRFLGKDFEDCLQAACAELAGYDQILTLDKNFAKHSGTKLPVTVV